MFKKKLLTLPELEKLEAEKLKEKSAVQARIKEWGGKRPEILIRIAEGDEAESRSARAELKAGDDQVREWETEIEIIEAYLQTFARQRDFARGVEIEALIPRIEKFDADLAPLLDDIRRKADALNKTNQKLFDALSVFDEFPQLRDLALRRELVSNGLGVLRHNSSMPRVGVASDPVTPDLSLALLGSTYNAETLQAWIDESRKALTARLDLMRDHAKRLKGEDLPSPKWAYCPNCYNLLNGTGKVSCPRCGKNVKAVY